MFRALRWLFTPSGPGVDWALQLAAREEYDRQRQNHETPDEENAEDHRPKADLWSDY